MKLMLAAFSAVLIGVFGSPLAAAADSKADAKKAEAKKDDKKGAK